VVFRLEDAGFFFLDMVMYESSYVQRRFFEMATVMSDGTDMVGRNRTLRYLYLENPQRSKS
jgi:hypothetical protein